MRRVTPARPAPAAGSRWVGPVLGLALVLAACGGDDTAEPTGVPDDRPPATSDPSPAPPSTAAPNASVSPEPPASLSAAGFDPEALAQGVALLTTADSDLHHLVVVRDGRTVLDATLHPAEADRPHDIASVTKTVTALVVGAAILRGDLDGLDQPLGDLLAETIGLATGERTLGELLGMRAGLECGFDDQGGEPALDAMLADPDHVAGAATLPSVEPAGERFAYCSPAYHLISAAIARATDRSLSEYADDVLFGPLGISEWSWSDDPTGVSHGWGDLSLTPAGLARIGGLVAERGAWEGEQLVDPGFMAAMTADPVAVDASFDYGLGVWLPAEHPGAVMARGRGGQFLLVDPDEALVVVGTGAGAGDTAIAGFVVGATSPAAAPDPDAETVVFEGLAALGVPPAAVEPTVPASAARLGARFAVDDNPLGIEAVAVESTGTEAVVTLTAFGDHPLRVGLDGVARIGHDTRTGDELAVVGAWNGTALAIDAEQIDGPDHWELVVDIGPEPTLTVEERTGRVPRFTVAAHAGG